MTNRGRLAAIGAAALFASVPALAVEGALGRTLPGVWIMPQAGVVGPTPGWSFTMMPIGYMGSISGNRQIPIAGALVVNASGDMNSNFLIPTYVYKTEIPKLSLSSVFMGVVNWVGVTASAETNNLALSRRNANAGMSDVVFAPVTAGIHFSDTNNLSISTLISAPTGAFTRGNLSNLGLNVWVVMPTVGHTYMWPKKGLELDNYIGFDIYSKNQATNYSNGTVFHWDSMLLKYVAKNRVGFGGIFSNLTQITNDSGPLATVLHGFEGRAWGAGPIALFVLKAEKPGITLQMRWVNEFAVTNLLDGNTLLLGLTFKWD